jgi:hypothetical protein
MPDCLRVRRKPHGALSSTLRILDRRAGIPAVAVVVGKLAQVLLEATVEDHRGRLCHLIVERQAPLVQQRVVGNLLCEGVLEGVLRVRRESLLVDELRARENPERGR